MLWISCHLYPSVKSARYLASNQVDCIIKQSYWECSSFGDWLKYLGCPRFWTVLKIQKHIKTSSTHMGSKLCGYLNLYHRHWCCFSAATFSFASKSTWLSTRMGVTIITGGITTWKAMAYLIKSLTSFTNSLLVFSGLCKRSLLSGTATSEMSILPKWFSTCLLWLSVFMHLVNFSTV